MVINQPISEKLRRKLWGVQGYTLYTFFFIETFPKNHVDPWCHKMCNPKYVLHLYMCTFDIIIIRDARSLDNVNTESCEQTFKYGFIWIS